MRKLVTGVLAVAAFAVPVAAFALVNPQDFGFQINGLSSNTVTAGQSFDISSTFDVNGGNEVEFIRTRLINSNGDIVHSQCDSVGRVSDVDDKFSTQRVALASDIAEGKYKVERAFFGKDGEPASNGCALADLLATKQYSDRLFVQHESNTSGGSQNNTGSPTNTGTGAGVGGGGTTAGSGAGGGTGGSTNEQPQWFKDWLAQQGNTGGSASSTDALMCALFKTHLARSVPGTRTPWNAVLQGFLLGAGESISSLVEPVKAPFGFSGPETAAAVSHFQLVHKCQ